VLPKKKIQIHKLCKLHRQTNRDTQKVLPKKKNTNTETANYRRGITEEEYPN